MKTYKDQEAMGVLGTNNLDIIKQVHTEGKDPSLYKNLLAGNKLVKIACDLEERGVDLSPLVTMGFSHFQKSVLLNAIIKGFDVTPCLNPQFDVAQMKQIIHGLEAGVDVSSYAKLDMSGEEMYSIRLNLVMSASYRPDDEKHQKAVRVAETYRQTCKFKENQLYIIYLGALDNLDVAKYANPKFSEARMRVIRRAMMRGLSIEKIADLQYNISEARAIYDELEEERKKRLVAEGKRIENGKSRRYHTKDNGWLEAYISRNPMMKIYEDCEVMGIFNDDTLNDIKLACEAGRDPSVWAKPGADPEVMKEANRLQRDGYDPSPLMAGKFNQLQLHELREAIRKGVDAAVVANPDYDARQMHFIISAMEEGADPSYFAKPGLSRGELNKNYAVYRMSLNYRPDEKRQQQAVRTIEQYRQTGKFTELKLYQIYLAVYDGLDITPYINTEHNWEQLREIRRGLSEGLDVSVYASPEYTAARMRVIRFALKNGYDTSALTDLRYNLDQARVLYDAMTQGVDYSSFADQSISARRMKHMLYELSTMIDECSELLSKVAKWGGNIVPADTLTSEPVTLKSDAELESKTEGSRAKKLNAF